MNLTALVWMQTIPEGFRISGFVIELNGDGNIGVLEVQLDLARSQQTLLKIQQKADIWHLLGGLVLNPMASWSYLFRCLVKRERNKSVLKRRM